MAIFGGSIALALAGLLGEFLESATIIDVERLEFNMRIGFVWLQFVRVRRAETPCMGIARQSLPSPEIKRIR